MNWIYKTSPMEDITQFPNKTFGFVYMTTHKPTGKSYIGKKVLFHNQKKKLGKKELAALAGIVGRRPSYKLLVEGKKDEFERTILKCVETKKQLTYFEIKYQMLYQVLEKPDEFFNDNILGKFFTRDLADIKFEDLVVERK